MTTLQKTQILQLDKKIVIGTAQLTMPYGICNKNNSISKQSIKKIFRLSNKTGVLFIDTALNYGHNDNVLKNYINNKYQVITKIPKFNRNHINSNKKVENLIRESLSKLNIKKFYAILLHSPNQLLNKNGSRIYQILLNLKKKKLTKNIGISVYSKNTTIKIIKKYKFNLIQLPFNIVNQEFNNQDFIKLVKKKKIEIHARSIFLQGILTNKKIRNKKFFSKWSRIFKIIDQIKKKNEVNDLELNINFCINKKWINKIIIGIDNFLQFKSILNTKIKNIIYEPIPMNIKKSLYDPRKW